MSFCPGHADSVGISHQDLPAGIDEQFTILGPPGIGATEDRLLKYIRWPVFVGADVVNDQLRTDEYAIPGRNEQIVRTDRSV